MSWAKGDRLKVTLEVTALESSDEPGSGIDDLWFPSGRSRDWIDIMAVEMAGGSVTVEVIPEPVELPTGIYSVVLIKGAFGNVPVTLVPGETWSSPYGQEIDEQEVREHYVSTIYEGGA